MEVDPILYWAARMMDAVKNQVVVFTPDVDKVLQNVPEQVWDFVALFGLFLGFALSLGGPRVAKLVMFLLSCLVGGLTAAYVLHLVNEDHVDPNLWLGIVSASALIVAFLVDRVVSVGKFIVFVSLGVMIAGVINQYGMAYLDNEADPWITRSVLVFCVIGSALLVWRTFEFAFDLTMSVVGGFVVLLSVARLTRSPLSLSGMWTNPELLIHCEDMKCWTPLIAGSLVCMIGLLEKLGIIGRESRHYRQEEQPLLS